MIDQLTIKGPLGAAQPHHQKQLSTVSYTRHLQTKVKPTTTFIASPITEAQIEVKYWVEETIAYVLLKIPLASALVGHNYFHTGLESIPYEVTCIDLLIRVVLTALGFSSGEVRHFRKNAETQLIELTWHTATASKNARINLQKRTRAFFDDQRSISAKHDIGVSDVDHRELNGKSCLLVSLKNGNKVRQYAKIDHASARGRRHRDQTRFKPKIHQHRQVILDKIATHVRNEVLLCSKWLKSMELQHPTSWTKETLKKAIDRVWQNSGLVFKRPSRRLQLHKELSSSANATLIRHLAGEPLNLPEHTFVRHRKAIKRLAGVDIAITHKARTACPFQLGKQLSYDRRWEPRDDIRKHVICEETAPAIIRELKDGLAFLADGTLPDFAEETGRADWLSRWGSFADRENGNRKALPKANSSSVVKTIAIV
jgi:hypothetical protein